MTKQEEIRKELKEYLRPNLKYVEESLIDGVVYMVLQKLHSQGVVIKVEDIQPINSYEDLTKSISNEGKYDIVVVESLI